jgi:hypothetical protein
MRNLGEIDPTVSGRDDAFGARQARAGYFLPRNVSCNNMRLDRGCGRTHDDGHGSSEDGARIQAACHGANVTQNVAASDFASRRVSRTFGAERLKVFWRTPTRVPL